MLLCNKNSQWGRDVVTTEALYCTTGTAATANYGIALRINTFIKAVVTKILCPLSGEKCLAQSIGNLGVLPRLPLNVAIKEDVLLRRKKAEIVRGKLEIKGNCLRSVQNLRMANHDE